MKKITYILLISLSLPLFCVAQTEDNALQFNGFIDTYHAIRTKSPNDFMSSRTRFRGEARKAFGKSAMFLSFNLNQNSILKEFNGFELREAYLDYSSSNWGLRAGRQLIIWGKADGLRITDLISPMDMTEFLARDYDDIRMPVEALRLSYFKTVMKLELVFIPIFKSFVFPINPRNPWAIKPSAPEGQQPPIFMEENRPNFTLKNSEIGARAVFSMSGIDFSLAALHTWNKMPIIHKTIKNNQLYLQPTYKRMTFVGGDFSKPLNQFVLRGDAAININKHFSVKQPNSPLQKRNTLNYLIGVDWYAPAEWMLSAQFSDEVVFDYTDALDTKKHTFLGTMSITKTLMNNALKLVDFAYIDLNDYGFFNRFSADYVLTDQIHLLAGYEHFHGDKGIFGNYKKNSEIWIKAKYSF